MTTVPALLAYVVRATRWRPVAAGAGSALVFCVAMTLAPVTLDVTGLIIVLRLAALLGAVGVAFLLDDPSESTTAVTPSPRRLRLILRPLVAAPPAVVWWTGVLLVLRADTDPQTWAAMPLSGLSAEAAGLLGAAVAIAAVGVRRPAHDSGGIVAALVVVGVVAAGQFLPEQLSPFPLPDSPAWGRAHDVWAGVPALAAGLLLWATRDLLATRLRLL